MTSSWRTMAESKLQNDKITSRPNKASRRLERGKDLYEDQGSLIEMTEVEVS